MESFLPQQVQKTVLRLCSLLGEEFLLILARPHKVCVLAFRVEKLFAGAAHQLGLNLSVEAVTVRLHRLHRSTY